MRSFSVVSGENALAQQFTNLRADAAGGGNLLVHQQLGFFTLSTNPTNGKTLTLTINGTAVTLTFVTSIGSTAGNVLIGATAAATCANLLALLNQPQTTTATGVALSAGNQTLLSYLSFALSGTTLTVSSTNTNLYAPLTSFSASTNATSDTWTSQTMQLYVEPGVVYVSGTRVLFTGGSTPTVTAPSSNPRIDVLTIDSSGTLAWTVGAENASPSAPTYPANKTPLIELYNVVSETSLYDNAYQQSGQGYVYNDVRAFLQPSMNWAAFTSDLIPDADGTRNLGSASFEWNNVYVKSSVFVNGVTSAVAKFGGTGADGALTSTSGTTTVSAAASSTLLKQYSSISITGTGKLAFSNPASTGTFIFLLCAGNATLTSSTAPMMDASNMGGAAGAGTGSGGGNGTAASVLPDFTGFTTNNGAGTTSGSNGAGGTIGSWATNGTAILHPLFLKYRNLQCGAGGGAGGAQGGATGANGGRGGGVLVMEIAGAINFTTASGISVAGTNGATGSAGSSQISGGGGGGGAGMAIITYNIVTAFSGTITASAGTGGNTVFNGFSNVSAGGGGGGSVLNSGANGQAAASSGNQGGGNGGAGYAFNGQNLIYA
jgi:hypothetical protein